MKKNFFRAYFFIIIVCLLTFILAYVMATSMLFEKGNRLFPLLWLLGYVVLIFNVCLIFTQTLFYVFSKEMLLPEVEITVNPMTAVVYPVKDETFGLSERIRYTIEKNREKNVHFWILSDSQNPVVLEYERDVFTRLQNDFADVVIEYRNRRNPTEKKQGNISHWIKESGNKYKYMVVCDADNILASGAVQKFIKKAEHPSNSDIAIFQGGLRIIHAKTFFSKFISFSTEFSQRFIVVGGWRIFGRAMSVGHGNLIRIELFSKVKLKNGIICHDTWESAYLDKMGYRVCLCEDIISYEDVPGNYLEARNRNSRWAKGTLQGWYLPFLPGISLASRYYIGYYIYSYLMHPFVLLWLISGFFCISDAGGELLYFQKYVVNEYSVTSLAFSPMLIGIVLVIVFHKIVACRTFADVISLFYERLFSMLIGLNNVFYISMDIITMPFNKFKWKPMEKNPLKEITLFETVKSLFPGTIFGMVCIFLGVKYSMRWLIIALPFVISFIGAIPSVYLTAMRSEGGMSEKPNLFVSSEQGIKK